MLGKTQIKTFLLILNSLRKYRNPISCFCLSNRKYNTMYSTYCLNYDV